jgi:hypothetical protein
MRVWANGYAVGNYTLSTEGFQKKSMEIPRSVLNGKTLNIVLELPDAASPSDAGLSTDSRHLGIAMQTLRIDRA